MFGGVETRNLTGINTLSLEGGIEFPIVWFGKQPIAISRKRQQQTSILLGNNVLLGQEVMSQWERKFNYFLVKILTEIIFFR